MKEASVHGDRGQVGGNDPLQDLGDSLEEDNDSEGSRRVVGLLARFGKDNPLAILREKGWWPKQRRGARRDTSMPGET